jgi:hypothetical protein
MMDGCAGHGQVLGRAGVFGEFLEVIISSQPGQIPPAPRRWQGREQSGSPRKLLTM